MIVEGWYLLNTAELEELLATRRAGEERLPEGARNLSQEEALAYRAAGNLPDEQDRSLRLVLRVDSDEDLRDLESKRARFEPDYLDAPTWRRAGSRPVNVVPLRAEEVHGAPQPWFEDPALAALEREWQETGRVAGVIVPEDYRSFVFKTVLSLRRAGRDVTAAAIADGVTRWLSESDAQKVRAALHD